MDIGQLFRRAWEITWKHKILWVFGLLIALASGAGGGSGSGYSLDGSEVRMPHGAVLALLIILALLVLVALIVLATIAQGALIDGARQAREKDEVKGSEAWRWGTVRFWPLLGIGALMFVVVLILIIPLIAMVLLAVLPVSRGVGAGEGGVFAVFDEDLVEHGDVLHGAEGDAGVGDSVAVVAEGDGPGSDHAAHFGEFLAFEALGDGADGEDVGVTELGVLSEDEVDGGFAVEGRVGVGHAGDAGESAGGGGAGAAGDGFLFLVSGFAEVDVHVDEAGGDEQAVGVDDGVGAGAIGPEVGDLAVFEEEVGLFVEPVGRVDHPAAGDEGSAVRHVSSSAYKDRGATGFMDRADHCTGRRCESKRRGRGNRRCPLDELAKRDSISGEELARRSGGPDGCDEGGQDGTRPEP